ncbi:MAG: cellulase family glycosylhydrolase [Armatimonadota bacterium]
MLIDGYIAPPQVAYSSAPVIGKGIPMTGNPYDAKDNDVVFLVTVKGRTVSFPAYYDAGNWKAKPVFPAAGNYKGFFYRNGTRQGSEITVRAAQTTSGFVYKQGTKFWLTDGKKGQSYWPIGHNLAWQGGQYKFREQMDLMQANGLNWTRIWACHWDNRNPYWPTSFPKPKDGEFSPEVLKRLDETVEGAEKNGLKFQFVLFHHGQVSTDVNPNWNDHPWNKKNGGFLNTATEFFTHPEAIKREKNFVRYAIARWGSSPSIMAWELFNEVQFVEAIRKGADWKTVAKWHDEMGAYIRSLDPYRHLITTSSELGQSIWSKMDFKQGHGYPSSISGLILGTPPDPKSPLFFGEIGWGDSGNSDRLAIRDGIWGAFFAGHSGAAQFWYWDQMSKPGMYGEYKRSIDVLSLLGDPMTFQRQKIAVNSPKGATLQLIPGRGWGKSDVMSFDLPADAEKVGLLSGYFQGTGHREMQPEPVSIKFTAEQPGEASINLAEFATGGSKAQVFLDGKEVFSKEWKGQGNKAESIRVPYTAGQHLLRIENNGPDWFRVRSIDIPGIMPVSSALLASNGDKSVIRINSAVGNGNTATCTIKYAKWKDGVYDTKIFDMSGDREFNTTTTIKGGAMKIDNLTADVLVVLTRRAR